MPHNPSVCVCVCVCVCLFICRHAQRHSGGAPLQPGPAAVRWHLWVGQLPGPEPCPPHRHGLLLLRLQWVQVCSTSTPQVCRHSGVELFHPSVHLELTSANLSGDHVFLSIQDRSIKRQTTMHSGTRAHRSISAAGVSFYYTGSASKSAGNFHLHSLDSVASHLLCLHCLCRRHHV